MENCELVVLLCGIAARLTDLYFYKGEFILSIPIPLYVPGWPLWGHKYVCAGVKNKETVSFMSRNTKAHWKWRPVWMPISKSIQLWQKNLSNWGIGSWNRSDNTQINVFPLTVNKNKARTWPVRPRAFNFDVLLQ